MLVLIGSLSIDVNFHVDLIFLASVFVAVILGGNPLMLMLLLASDFVKFFIYLLGIKQTSHAYKIQMKFHPKTNWQWVE